MFRHYATETFGVQALAKEIAQQFDPWIYQNRMFFVTGYCPSDLFHILFVMKKIGLLNGPNLDRLGNWNLNLWWSNSRSNQWEMQQAGLEFDTEIHHFNPTMKVRSLTRFISGRILVWWLNFKSGFYPYKCDLGTLLSHLDCKLRKFIFPTYMKDFRRNFVLELHQQSLLEWERRVIMPLFVFERKTNSFPSYPTKSMIEVGNHTF